MARHRILNPTFLNVLMENLVNHPFLQGTRLLCSADCLAQVVTRVENQLTNVQNAFGFIPTECELLGLKILAQKSKTMRFGSNNLNIQLCIQQVNLMRVSSYQH